MRHREEGEGGESTQAELDVVRSSPRWQVDGASDVVERERQGGASGKRPLEAPPGEVMEMEPAMMEAARHAPELAEHERGSKVMQKEMQYPGRSGTSTKWGVWGHHKTFEKKVLHKERVKLFPDQSLN